jgi:hypothetical protein
MSKSVTDSISVFTLADDSTKVAVNLRHVRYAIPFEGATRIFFGHGSMIAVKEDFQTVYNRMRIAFDTLAED